MLDRLACETDSWAPPNARLSGSTHKRESAIVNFELNLWSFSQKDNWTSEKEGEPFGPSPGLHAFTRLESTTPVYRPSRSPDFTPRETITFDPVGALLGISNCTSQTPIRS